MRTYNRADTVYVACTHQTYNLSTDAWTTADADDNYPKITITDPAGTVKVNGTSMTKITTGKYESRYELASDATQGEWSGFVETSNNEYTDRKYFSFAVR